MSNEESDPLIEVHKYAFLQHQPSGLSIDWDHPEEGRCKQA